MNRPEYLTNKNHSNSCTQETVAHYLQDPFHNRPSDTPMSALCRTIEINILELIEENEKPEPLTSDDEGVLM